MTIKVRLEEVAITFKEARAKLADALAAWVKDGYKPVSDAAFVRCSERGIRKYKGTVTVAKMEAL